MNNSIPIGTVYKTLFAAATISALALFVMAACNSGGTEMSYKDNDTQEVNTPTSCLKNQGRYYDPKQKQCIKVDNQHQARVLDAYRYVNKIAEEGKLIEVEYSMDFHNYIPLNKAEEFWHELAIGGAKMYGVFGRLPESIHGGCGWHHDFDAAPEENTIKAMIQKDLDTIAANPAMNADIAANRKAIFDDDLCRIESMWFIAKPSLVRDFWSRHLDDIEGIQAYVTTLDRAQPAFGPTESFPGDK